jgi:hypothetical protein
MFLVNFISAIMTLDDRSCNKWLCVEPRTTKEHFEEHLNEGSEQPTRPVDLRDDEVDIDLPSREEIEGALKYLNSKTTRQPARILSRPNC